MTPLAFQFSPHLTSGQWGQALAWLSALLSLLFLLGLAAKLWLRRSIPSHHGEVTVSGLDFPVVIRRDRFGVPTIGAESLADALFGQGFCQAQDRLWQMELNRRIGSGRLAEIFGKEALPADIFLRRLGLRRAARSDLDALSFEEGEFLQAFCAGVNEGIRSLKTLPVELRLLGIEPEPWEPLDSLTWIQVMSMDLCCNWEQELLRGRILEELGPKGAELLHLFEQKTGVTLPPGGAGPEALKGLWELYEQAKAFLPNGGLPGGSNAWVISGKLSKSGRPLLANDPHLVGRVPSIWYESRLRTPDLDVRGATFAGVPFIVVGANRDIAWGITNSYADTQDLFIERFSSNNPSLYQTESGFQELERVEELIQVKGSQPHGEVVEYSRHGPVLFRNDKIGLALKWKNFEPSHPVQTLSAMNQATSAREFKEALRTWQAPSSNFVYADRFGDIGYLMAGHVPIRKQGTGLTPVPGWNGEFEWDGQIPFEELPQVENPESGYVVTANNPVVDESYPHHITYDWLSSARAARIEALLLSKEGLDLDDFAAVQMDVRCTTGLRFVQACQKLELQDPKVCETLDFLGAWNGDGSPESCEMTVYQVVSLNALQDFLEKVMGENLALQFLGQSSNPVSLMAGHTGRYTVWFVQLLDDPQRYQRFQELFPKLDSLESLLERAFLAALSQLENGLGKDRSQWYWGRLHRLQFKHPMGVNYLLGRLFNGPSAGAGGDTDTVFQTALNPQSSYEAEAWCPSFRHLVELGKELRYFSIIPTGQSGHPASPNYMDQFLMWCQGDTKSYRLEGRELRLKPTAS